MVVKEKNIFLLSTYHSNIYIYVCVYAEKNVLIQLIFCDDDIGFYINRKIRIFAPGYYCMLARKQNYINNSCLNVNYCFC